MTVQPEDNTPINRLPTPVRATSLESTSTIREIRESLHALANAKPNDVQQIAASQIKLLTAYYGSVLEQASASFRSALVLSIVGVTFFLAAITVLLVQESQNAAILSTIIGAIIEAISGLNFWLYGKATTQLADFHQRLDQTQRFLLANSICTSLDGQAKQDAITKLVATMVAPGIDSSDPKS